MMLLQFHFLDGNESDISGFSCDENDDKLEDY